ncbi:MAG TPA: DNA mismatch repair endonuclease MutL [Lachnospiraceae bacterium]|nr:DNA mismatch repair endonuclease MutL [Lachnospiraceae bacterium]
MPIKVLDKLTIDQIAAGEVIERPLSVVKELVENSIDSGADTITVEISDGGRKQIRVSDNGCGIRPDELHTAFLRHATSKIADFSDLSTISSLGFRGEALSSIAAISKVEVITRVRESIVGARYVIEGGDEISLQEIGSPEGTTFIVRDIFYNTPARLKFLKSSNSESTAITECIQHFAMSHPLIRFQLITDGKPKIKTSGDRTLKTNIYTCFGKELGRCLVPIDINAEEMSLEGYIAKPEFSRGNRSYMHYFVNGRYVKNNTIHAAIMDGYRDYLMNHRFPFTALKITVRPDMLDVNVHPSKMEIRFKDERAVYDLIYHAIKNALDSITLIPEERLGEGEDVIDSKQVKPMQRDPEPFERSRLDKPESQPEMTQAAGVILHIAEENTYNKSNNTGNNKGFVSGNDDSREGNTYNNSFLEKNLFREEEAPSFRIIGQVFDTYWLIEYRNELLIIDQHAAHEKVLYEHFVAKMRAKTGMSQRLIPPIVLTLSGREQGVLNSYADEFKGIGFEWEDFGDTEILIQSVPADFLNLDPGEIFIDILDTLMDEQAGKKPEMILDHLATISCKAAIKGNNTLSVPEAKKLISEMLSLDEPYHCPHGRPTTITMSKYEFDKKFKRII